MADEEKIDKNQNIAPGHPGNPYGRWKPGQSGNPLGRPKSKPFKEALERMLAVAAQQRGINQENAHDLVASALIAKAVSGDVAALKEFADRTEGKVPNPIGGTDELPPITAFSWKAPDQVFIEQSTQEST